MCTTSSVRCGFFTMILVRKPRESIPSIPGGQSPKERAQDDRAWSLRNCNLNHQMVAALLCLLLSFCAVPTQAQQRSWRIADFSADIEIHKNGSADIDERISLVFIGSFHGIHRYIPMDYVGPEGSNYSLFLKIQKVTDEDGEKLSYSTKNQGGYRVLTIMIPGATDTSKRIHIRYAVTNAVKFFEDHDEFYWNVTGNGWPVPIDAASVFVRLPTDAAGKLRAQSFAGVYHSDEKAMTDIQGANVVAQTENPLPARGGLTLDV